FKELTHTECIALAQRVLFFYYMVKNQFEKSLSLLQESLTYYTDLRERIAVADTLEMIGIYYYSNMIDYDQALAYFQKCLAIREKVKHTFGIARVYHFIADVYSEIYENELGLDYLQRSLNLMEQLQYENEIAWIYFKFGEYYTFKTEFSQATNFIQKSLTLFNKVKNQKGIATCYMRLGGLALVNGDFTKAQKYQEQSIQLWNELKIRTLGYGVAIGNLGWVKRELGQLDESLECFQKFLTVGEELGKRCEIAQALQEIGTIYRLKGKYKQAFKLYQRGISIQRKLAGNYYVDGQKGWNCYCLTVLITQYFPEENALQYVKELEQIHGRNEWNEQAYPVAKALYLKTSKRVRDHYKAQEILEKAIKETSCFDPVIGFTAHLSLCELLIRELRTSGEEEVFQEVKTLVDDIQTTLTQQNIVPLQIEMQILQAKIQQIQGDFDQSVNFLEQAIQQAKTNDLVDMMNKIQREQDFLEETFDTWQKLIQNNAPFQERLKQAQLEDYVKTAVKRVNLER
ncbi:MAG: tetratricopeptide repeat protein, partial [Promethearchaeota archaeon]